MNIDEILNGAKTAFINQHNSSSADFTPKLLYNNRDSKVINSLRDELRGCDEFIISSAFITMGGITPLLEEFRYLEKSSPPTISPSQNRKRLKNWTHSIISRSSSIPRRMRASTPRDTFSKRATSTEALSAAQT